MEGLTYVVKELVVFIITHERKIFQQGGTIADTFIEIELFKARMMSLIFKLFNLVLGIGSQG